jgi:hypothetical protein
MASFPCFERFGFSRAWKGYDRLRRSPRTSQDQMACHRWGRAFWLLASGTLHPLLRCNSAQLIASRQCVRRLQRPEDNAGLGLCVGAARCTIRRAPAAHIGDPQPCHLYRCTASVGHPGFVPLPAAVAPTSSASPGLSPSLADGWFGFGVPPVLTGPHRVRNKPEKCAALRPAATLPSHGRQHQRAHAQAQV